MASVYDYTVRTIDGRQQSLGDFRGRPLLIVNVADIDFINNPSHFDQLRAEVARPRRGRHYFNPYLEG